MLTVPPGERIFGIQLPVQAQSQYFVFEWERRAGPIEMVQIAEACDASGFSYLGVCDHVSLPEAVAGSMGTHWMDPVATLAWLAARTERIGLLTHVFVLPYRHPLMAAKHFATIDYLSGGRMICGIGAGHVEAEFDHLGVDFHRRGSALDDGIPLLMRALEEEFVDGFGARPRPAQHPRPPIWIAGSSPAAIRRAALLGDGWLPQGPSNAAMVSLLEQELIAAGRADVPFVIGHITPFIHVGSPTRSLREGTISGAASAIAEQVLAGTAPGVNQLQVRFDATDAAEYCNQVAAFGAEVAPLIREIS
jgi:probable F420-dependent oxidoreductase